MRLQILRSIHEVSAHEWNALNTQAQPFLQHEFLAALEDTHCAVPETGWTATHLVVKAKITTAHKGAEETVVAAMPLYLKAHSYGEFVFDFSWAEAYAQAGLRYYPKLVSAVPFTPATGDRILLAPSASTEAITLLRQGLAHLAQQTSTAHVLYVSEQTLTHLNIESGDPSGSLTWIPRLQCDFHWYNRNYPSLEHYFERFRADKRKKTNRERRRVAEQGISFRTLHGNELTPALCTTIFAFSEATFHAHGHEHYLNSAFFTQLAKTMPHRLMIKLAEHNGQAIAAAIFFRSESTLYGRYWGCASTFNGLHFEACYYQGIDYCIEHGLSTFEPGTQGEHKLARGFEPTLAHSVHAIQEPAFRSAIARHLQQERAMVQRYAETMREHLPFHRNDSSQAGET